MLKWGKKNPSFKTQGIEAKFFKDRITLWSPWETTTLPDDEIRPPNITLFNTSCWEASGLGQQAMTLIFQLLFVLTVLGERERDR